MKSMQKLNLIRIGMGDYAMGKSAPLYKEVMALAKKTKVISASIFKSVDGYLFKGNPERVRLLGGHHKSQTMIIELLVEQEMKEQFLGSVRKLVCQVKDPVVISVMKTKMEVFGLDA